MTTTTNANIGFEKQIWDAACVLRGNIDASEYKSVVLGLIFLKYISDRFEANIRNLSKKEMALRRILMSIFRKIFSLCLKMHVGV